MLRLSPEDNWTVVLAGEWNVRLFTPQWVGTHLLGEARLEIMAALTPGVPSIRYNSHDVALYPGDQTFVVAARQQTDSALARAEQVAVRVLELLAHTPVTGVGINFNQVEREPSEELRRLVNLPDRDTLAGFGCVTQQTGIARQFLLETTTLNTRFEFGLPDGAVGVNLNFHFGVRSAAEAAGVLRDRAVPSRETASRFLQTVYNTALQTEEIHEPV